MSQVVLYVLIFEIHKTFVLPKNLLTLRETQAIKGKYGKLKENKILPILASVPYSAQNVLTR